jgi:uncharacterized membrane protein required for colicin V production
MNWLDSVIVALLATAAVLGAYSGLLMQIFRLVGFGASLYGSLRYHASAVPWLGESLMKGADPRVVAVTAFAGLFLGIYLAIFLATLLMEKGVRATQLQFLNRSFGALLSIAKMSLLIGGVCYGFQRLPYEPTKQAIESSRIAVLMARGIEQGAGLVPEEWKNDLTQSWIQIRESLPAAAESLKGTIPPPISRNSGMP